VGQRAQERRTQPLGFDFHLLALCPLGQHCALERDRCPGGKRLEQALHHKNGVKKPSRADGAIVERLSYIVIGARR
jgi:hypothetical protein